MRIPIFFSTNPFSAWRPRLRPAPPRNQPLKPGKTLTKTTIQRRAVLGGLIGAAVAGATPAPLWAMRRPVHRLHMTNPRTGEVFHEVMVEDKAWVPPSLDAFAHFARDWRREKVMEIDPKAVLILLNIQNLLETSTPLILLSGYRAPETNRSIRGAANNSLHMLGQACDIRHPDRSVSQVHAAARQLRAGGVGKYSARGFVHIDCGRLRYWGS